MALAELGSASCVTLGDFSDLLSIAFGINLALPVFRELVVYNRRATVARLPALQSIIESRTYTESEQRQAHLRALTKAKTRLISCDRELGNKINYCSVITFLFALASLGWLVYGVYDKSCVSGGQAFLAVGVTFLPLPLSIMFLAAKSHLLFSELNADLDQLQAELM